jgi:hypothetical protein
MSLAIAHVAYDWAHFNNNDKGWIEGWKDVTEDIYWSFGEPEEG